MIKTRKFTLAQILEGLDLLSASPYSLHLIVDGKSSIIKSAGGLQNIEWICTEDGVTAEATGWEYHIASIRTF